jgi:hypothetical protein
MSNAYNVKIVALNETLFVFKGAKLKQSGIFDKQNHYNFIDRWFSHILSMGTVCKL